MKCESGGGGGGGVIECESGGGRVSRGICYPMAFTGCRNIYQAINRAGQVAYFLVLEFDAIILFNNC